VENPTFYSMYQLYVLFSTAYFRSILSSIIFYVSINNCLGLITKICPFCCVLRKQIIFKDDKKSRERSSISAMSKYSDQCYHTILWNKHHIMKWRDKKKNKIYENENVLSDFLLKKVKKWIYTSNISILSLVKERKNK